MASLKLVYSLAPADDRFRERLSSHLHSLVQKGQLIEWHEQLIPPGSDRTQERRLAWRSADILLLLLSADYFSSDACNNDEIQEALERHRQGTLLLVPILIRPCDWQATPLVDLQLLPRNKVPVTTWADQDEAFLSIALELRQLLSARGATAAPLSALQRTNRWRLLKLVRSTWIDGMLDASLHHAVWVDLHLQKQPSALDNSWRLMVQELASAPRPLPAGTSIIQVFDEADEELLILGAPGSGKTTLLLYLARTLLDRAEIDESRRLPVIFHLSAWAQKRLPLDQWFLEEMQIRYQVSPQIGRAWIESNSIFPLLDGLDEVTESARPACVQAIQSYTRRSLEHIPLVVCCRSDAYDALPLQLPLQYTIMLLPFTGEQIDFYLSSISGQLDVLRRALAEDRELFELARRPLMLSVFAQAYRGAVSVALPSPATHNEYPRAIFRYYVQQMLSRRTSLQRGTAQQMYRWLGYLARQMQDHQQTLLTVEYLQPTWLPAAYRAWYRRSMPLVYGLAFGLLFGPIFGLAFACIYGLIYRTLARLAFGLSFGLLVGVIGGLVGGLAFGLIFRQHSLIQPAEASSWSWTAAKKGLLIGLSGGLAVGAVGGLVGGIITGVAGGLAVGLAVVLLIGLIGGLVSGLSPLQLSERAALSPNEGIWRSGKRGLIFVLLAVLLFGLAGGLLVGLLGSSIVTIGYGLLFGLILGAGGGLIFGLAFGLVGGRTGMAAFLQHFTLRFFLWRLKLLPWWLVAFLNEATERLLLRRAGGSYLFIHRLLRDVLADQEDLI
jgi:energy-coupling factor transporter ATP-binding protein EcfA2